MLTLFFVCLTYICTTSMTDDKTLLIEAYGSDEA